jgi:hypothetical protein
MPTTTTTAAHPRTALYARVSTTGHGQDVGLQLDELRQVARQRGWCIVTEEVDDGVSGATAAGIRASHVKWIIFATTCNPSFPPKLSPSFRQARSALPPEQSLRPQLRRGRRKSRCVNAKRSSPGAAVGRRACGAKSGYRCGDPAAGWHRERR